MNVLVKDTPEINTLLVKNDGSCIVKKGNRYAIKRIFLCCFLFILITNISFARNRYWVASSAANWNNTANWSNSNGGSGGFSVPSALDNAVFTAKGVGNCTIDITINLARISIRSGFTGIIDLSGFTMTIAASTNSMTFGSGTFNDTLGSGQVSITTSGEIIFSGTTFGAQLIINAASLFFDGSIFNTTTSFIKTGSSNDFSSGGCAFNGAVTFTNSGTGDINLGLTNPDIFNDDITIIADSADIHIARASSGNLFNGNIIIESLSNSVTLGLGGGTMIMRGTAAQSINVVGGTPAPIFYSLEIDNAIYGVTLNTPITISNDLTITNGTFDVSISNSQINLGGNFTNNGEFNAQSGKVVFDGSNNQTISGSSTSNFTNIIVNKTGGNISIESAVNLYQTLDIQSATIFDADGTGSGVFTLISSATEDSRIATLATGASITGNLVFEKYFGGQGIKYWRHISSAVLDVPVSDLQQEIPISGTFTGNDNGTGVIPANAFPSLYYYDNATGLATDTKDDRWLVYPTSTNTELLTTSGTEARGYAIWVRNTGAITYDLSGTVNQGNKDFTPTGNNEGWNFLGNPYPSDIDWDNSGWTKTDVQGNTIHIWNGTQYLIWNGSIGSLGSGRIAKGQGFWIQAFSGSVGLTATEAIKTSTASTTYRLFDPDRPLNIELSISASGYNDRTYIQFNDESPFTFDKTDAAKLANPIFNLSTLSADSVVLSINLLNGNKCTFDVPVRLTNTWNDNYSFAWTISQELLDVYQIKLEDNYTAEVYDINSGAIGFNFDIDDNLGSRSAQRFVLHFKTSPIDNFIISSSQSCDNLNKTVITVSASQFGVEYSIWQDGGLINSLNGTGEMLQFELDSTTLITGINSFLVKATSQTCSKQQVELEIEFTVLAEPAISYDADQNLLVNNTGQVGQWYNGEILITDTPSNNITPSLLLGGAYSITVSSENCQLQSSPFLITAIEEISSSNIIDVYPNPATDYIEVRLKELIGQEVSISIRDINGRVHFLKEIAAISEKIDLKNIPQGIYILLLESRSKLYKSRFVKL